jgi:hypothetical protein
MRRVIVSLIASIIVVALSGGSGFSQTPQKPETPKSAAERRHALEEREAQRRQRTLEADKKLASAVAATKAKRAACNQEAKQQGLGILKRRGFVSDCMKR